MHTTGTAAGSPEFMEQFDRPGAIIANIIAHVIAVMPSTLYILVAPVLMRSFDADKGDLATMLSSGLIMMSVAAFLVGLTASRVNLRYFAVLGMVLHITSSIVSLLATDWTGIIIGRSLAGLGDGIVLAACNAVLGRSTHNTRNWAISSFATGLVASLVTFGLGQYLDSFGPNLLFGGLLVIGILGTPVMFFLPTHTLPPELRGVRSGNGLARIAGAMGNPIGLLLMLGASLVAMGDTLIFSFSSVLGDTAGYGMDQIGTAHSMAYVCATIASLLIIVIGTRFGRARPLILITAIFCFGSVLVTLGGGFGLYAAAVCAIAASFRVVVPFLYGVAARHDATGGLTGGFTAFAGIGGAIGPSLAVVLLGGSDNYFVVGIAAAAIFVTGAMIHIVVAFTQERNPAAALAA